MGLLILETGLIVVFFKDPLALHPSSTEDTVVVDGEAEGKKEAESS